MFDPRLESEPKTKISDLNLNPIRYVQNWIQMGSDPGSFSLLLSSFMLATKYKIQFSATYVDGSGMRILLGPRGKQVSSVEFPPFPGKIATEPAGNIYGRWKQFSCRNSPVTEPVTSDSFQVPDKKWTQYPAGCPQEQYHI